MQLETVRHIISELKVCILIPTYNNQHTLNRVVDGVLKYTDHILIVNDGSTDSTSKILQTYSDIEQIHFLKNKGKGIALREGFKKAYQLGYSYVISIDSDGQHYPEDIITFIEAIQSSPNSLLIGDRNMNQEGIPKKSSFGNKFSNFWYQFETGVKLTDTQSGYRLYPLEKLANLTYFTNKFEFEIEVIVRASWKGIEVKNIPIRVLYDENERVSHFRPFKDFTRISILNTVLVLIALLYIKPGDLFKSLKKKGIKQFFLEDLLQSNDAPEKKALSIALGVFIGISPLWGFHTALVILLAVSLKLNKLIAFTFSNVSLPPFIPFIVIGSLKLGAFLLGEESITMDVGHFNFETFNFKDHIIQYVLGSFSLAISLALFFGFLGYIILKFFTKQRS